MYEDPLNLTVDMETNMLPFIGADDLSRYIETELIWDVFAFVLKVFPKM